MRIVKRESERRQRDRDRSGNIGIPIGNVAVAKRVSVIDENDGYGLGRVEEESSASYDHPVYNSSMYAGKEILEDYGMVPDDNEDVYLNYNNSKNHFLFQNLGNHGDEILVVDTDPSSVGINQNKKSMSLPRGFGKNVVVPNRYDNKPPEMRNVTTKRNRVRVSIVYFFPFLFWYLSFCCCRCRCCCFFVVPLH